MTAATASLDVVRGIVTVYKKQMDSVRVNQTTGYGKINSTCELWLRDSAGHEHRFQGELFEAAQPGHEVAVVSDRTSGKLIAFANVTTQKIHDAAELTVKTTPGVTIISTFGFGLLLALPGLFPWFMMLDAIGLADSAFSATGLQTYAILLLGCIFAGVTIWSKRYEERTARLKAEIDRVLGQKAPTVLMGNRQTE
ncbi:MAG: hypothetical protein R8G34_11120 [Paracoccaceae bacterium]|nr:hypothetical protein [Paracoccaceae bacterium]